MAITAQEAVDSRTFGSQRKNGVSTKTIQCIYFVYGTDDTAVAESDPSVPQDGDAYPDGRIQAEVISRTGSVFKVGGTEGGVCKITVNYGAPEQATPPDDEPEYELSMMAETVNIKSAISQLHFPASASSVNNAIGVDADKVQGVDKYVPKGTYKEVRYLTSLSRQLKQRIGDISSTVNSKPWKDWEAGEVLFLGAVATRKGNGKWRVEYNFSISKSVDQSIETDAGVQEFTKLGWEYMWIETAQRANEDKTKVLNTNAAVHVAQIYDATDFGLLGLGT